MTVSLAQPCTSFSRAGLESLRIFSMNALKQSCQSLYTQACDSTLPGLPQATQQSSQAEAEHQRYYDLLPYALHGYQGGEAISVTSHLLMNIFYVFGETILLHHQSREVLFTIAKYASPFRVSCVFYPDAKKTIYLGKSFIVLAILYCPIPMFDEKLFESL